MSPRPEDPHTGDDNEIIDEELQETDASWTAPPPPTRPDAARPPPPPRDVETQWTQDPDAPTGGGEKRRVQLLMAGAGVFGLLFIIMFIYACHVGSQRDSARSKVVDLEDQNQQSANALDLLRNDKGKVDTQLVTCTQEKEAGTTQVTRIEADLSACQQSTATLKEQADKQKREFDEVTADFRDMIDTGALKVEIRRGQMVVDLPAEVLFPSGRASLTKPGQAALGKVAAILRKMPGRHFIVAGHTDTYKTVGKEFHGNWDLSAARAVTVVEALIADGLNPRRLMAAGFGEYAPVASNGSEKGRQQNRRIEIILEPDLSKVKDEIPKPPPKPAPKKKGK
jgi:chemotaxis protein MotB